MRNNIFIVGNNYRRAYISRFIIICRVEARKKFGGLVLSYCSPSSAVSWWG